jgi:hypothetical protein
MKRVLFFTVFLLLISSFIYPQAASAHFSTSGMNVDIPNSKVVNGTSYISGSTVNINGTYTGDIFCAGQTVTIDANVTGDILCAGQSVIIDGTVTGNIRVAAQTLVINATVSKNVSIASQSATISGTTSGDVSALAQSVTIKGNVGGEVYGAVRSFTLNGKVAKGVDVHVQNATLGGNSMIGGNFKYAAPQRATMASGAIIKGQTLFSMQSTNKNNSSMFSAFSLIYWPLSLFVIGLVLILLCRKHSYEIGQKVLERPWLCLGVGLIPLFLLPIVAFVILFTLIGIPLSLLMFMVWIIALMLSTIAVSYAIGLRILQPAVENLGMSILALLLGMVITTVLFNIPFIGWLFSLLAVIIGLGALSLVVIKYWKMSQ